LTFARLAAEWISDYLDFDENRALAVKAIWALDGLPGSEAERTLRQLLRSGNEIVREAARDQLKRREESGSSGSSVVGVICCASGG
jgi:hypothetical protein